MKVLENDLIRLRALEPSDVNLLYKWENDSEIWPLSRTYAPFSRHVLKQYIETAHLSIFETGQLKLIMQTKAEKRDVGAIDLFDFDAFNSRAGVGILVSRAADRQKGYAAAALDLLVQYAFAFLKLHQLYCNILASNTASFNLFTHEGFVVCGTKKDWQSTLTGYEDEYMLQLISPYTKRELLKE